MIIEGIYIWFIVVVRILVVVLGAAVAGMLVNYWLLYSDTLTTSQKRGITVLLLGALNSVVFTLLVLLEAKPSFPESTVAVGYLLFLVSIITLFFDPENRRRPRP